MNLKRIKDSNVLHQGKITKDNTNDLTNLIYKVSPMYPPSRVGSLINRINAMMSTNNTDSCSYIISDEPYHGRGKSLGDIKIGNLTLSLFL